MVKKRFCGDRADRHLLGVLRQVPSRQSDDTRQNGPRNS